MIEGFEGPEGPEGTLEQARNDIVDTGMEPAVPAAVRSLGSL